MRRNLCSCSVLGKTSGIGLTTCPTVGCDTARLRQLSVQSKGRLGKKTWSHRLSAVQALEWIEQWTAFPCKSIDHQLVRIAIERSERYAISYWDAAILAAAEALGATTVYSEDLNDGQRYGQVRVINPFR